MGPAKTSKKTSLDCRSLVRDERERKEYESSATLPETAGRKLVCGHAFNVVV
jgi:hypothetical protein